MTDKDVRLIIKARDEASKTVNAINESLAEFRKENASIEKAAGKSGSVLATLGSEFRRLNTQVAGLTSLGKVAGQITRVEDAISRLDAEAKKASGDFTQLSGDLEKARAAAGALQTQVKEAAAALETEKRATDASRAAQSAAAAELKKAQTAYERTTKALEDKTAQEKLAQRQADAATRVDTARPAAAQAVAAYQQQVDAAKRVIEAENQKVAALKAAQTAALEPLRSAEQAYARITRVINEKGATEERVAKQTAASQRVDAARPAADAAIAAYKAQVEASKQVIAAENARTSAFRQAQAAANNELASATAAYERLTKAIAEKGATDTRVAKQSEAAARLSAAQVKASEATAAYEAQSQRQEQLAQSLLKLTSASREADSQQNKLAAELDKTSAAGERARSNLDKAQQELEQMKASAAGVSAALGDVALNQESISKASADAADQLNRTQAEMEAMQRFSAGGGIFTDPKSAEAIRRQREEVERARQAWELLRAQTERMRAAMSSTVAPTQAEADALRQSAAAAREAQREYQRTLAALNAMPGAVQKGSGLRGLFSPIYGESRQAMSVLQRVRGEVLSLTTSYLGLYAAIQNIGGVIGAYRTLEAAQNRLGVVFGQNDAAVAQEMEWLERQATRLGYSFQTLSDSYTKFAVAASASNFEIDATRKIFMALSEAGRVNKLSTDQLGRAFLALEQIISKGKFSAEEVRQQMGEALPGAFQILADALGMTGAELSAAMQKGEVFATQSNLLKFADALNKRFGAQLPKAFDTLTFRLDRFFNDIFKGQTLINQGGFADALANALDALNESFQSREGRDFFLSIGAALGNLINVAAKVPQYFGAIAEAVRVIIAFKLSTWFLGLSKSMLESAEAAKITRLAVAEFMTSGQLLGTVTASMRTSFASLTAVLATVRGGFTAAGVAATLTQARLLAMRGAVAAMSGAFTLAAGTARALWAAIGGVPGVIMMAATYALTAFLGKWIGGVDEATAGMDEHERIMQNVLAAYEELGKKTDDWAKSIKNVTLDQANADVRHMREEMDKAREAVGDYRAKFFDSFNLNFDSQAREVARLKNAFLEGKMSAKDFVASVEEIYKATKNDTLREYAEGLLDLGRKAEAAEKSQGSAALVAKKLGSEVEGLDKNIQDAGVSFDALSEPIQAVTDNLKKSEEQAKKYSNVLDELKGLIPELGNEMKKLKEITALNDLIDSLGQGPLTQEMRSAYDRARQAIDDKYTNYEAIYTAQRGTPAGSQMEEVVREVARVAEQLGVSAKDILTVMSFETGGSFNPRVKGGKNNDYYGLIQFSPENRQKYGLTGSETIAEQVQAAGKYLVDAGVKAGDGLLQIEAAVQAGDARKIHASDASNGGTPGDVLDKVSNQMDGHQKKAEALIATYGGVVKEVEQNYKAQEAATKEIEKQNEATAKTLEDKRFELQQQQLINDGKGREAAIEAAIHQARQENKNIGDAEIAQITDLVGKQYDLEHRLDAVKKKEEEINNLTTIRGSLMDQIEYYQGQGNFDKAEELKLKLTEVNAELLKSIDAAIAMYRAMGGPDADAAIAKLEQTRVGLQNLGQTAVVSGKEINDSIADGVVSAFDSFAQAIANGENAFAALRDAALKALGEIMIEIGKAIIKATILKALTGSTQGGSGGVGGFISGLVGMLFHDGGEVGIGGTPRLASPSWFANARRYHEGGIPGLKPGEVPAILREGEVVDPGDGSFFSKMVGQQKQVAPVVKVVNAFDAASVVSEGMNSPVGEETFLNMVRSNSSAIKQALGVA